MTPEQLEELIEYYVNLLIIQYNDRPKARATIAAFVSEVIASGIVFDIREGFNLLTAVGAQLDILGKYIGVTRSYQLLDLSGYFSLITYADVPSPPGGLIGFSDYSNFLSKDGKFLQYSDLVSANETQLLNDASYRIILQLKIGQNNSNHSHGSIDALMFKIFGTAVYADSPGDMVMYYFVPIALSAIMLVAIQQKVLPKPMGVGLRLIKYGAPFFGFATYSGYSPLITGFSNYSNYATKEGQFLKYSDITT